jgi:hypothetical protein
MPRIRGGLALAAALTALGRASLLTAQVPGLPVWRPLPVSGVVFEGEAAWPNDAAGGGSVVGAAVAYGQGGVTLRGSLARVARDGSDAEVGWAGFGRVGLAGSRSTPFRVGAFVGVGGVRLAHGTARATTYRVPVGLDVGIVVPTPVVILGAWLAPRLDLATADPFASKRLDARAGFAAGIDIELLNGLGVRAGYDRVLLEPADESTFGVGILFRFNPGF